MQKLRRHLTYANVAATLALVIAIAGGTTAIAGNKIGASDLKKIKVRTALALPSGGQAIATAKCLRGEKLLGGGGSAEPVFNGSGPSGNSWVVVGSGSGSASATALCLSR